MAESVREIAVERDRSIDRAQRCVVVARKEGKRHAGRGKDIGIISYNGDGLPRQTDPLGDFRAGIRDPMTIALQIAAAADERHRRGIAGIE